MQGNLIGTNAAGNSIVGTDGKPLGNAGFGVLIYQGNNNTIGGTTTGAGNVISGNQGVGVGIGVAATGNIVQGNDIGTDATGTLKLGNTGAGVSLDGGPNNNVIGSPVPGAANPIVYTVPGAANTIAYNGSDGVDVRQGYAISIRGNSIHDNAGLGINLGVLGANNQQAPPLPDEADPGANTSVTGTFHSAANNTYTLDFYANTAPDASGHGEGRRYLGSLTVTTDANGNTGYSGTLPGASSLGEYLTATATDAAGDTSPFSWPIPINGHPTPFTFTVTTTADSGVGSLRQAILDSNATPDNAAGPNVIQFDITATSDTGGGFNATTGVATNTPQSALPTITNAVLIDGYRQPGSSGNTNAFGLADNAVLKVELDGAATGNAYGLEIETPNTTVRGLVINRFSALGLFVGGDGSGKDWIYGNFIGVDPTGTVNEGNWGGIVVGTNNVTIGSASDGHDALERNLISGSRGGNGIHISGSNDVAIQGNYIGTDATGNVAIVNQGNDIDARGTNSQLRVVGNLISGDGSDEGISLTNSVSLSNVVIQGNRIGTNAAGTAGLGNLYGIHMNGSFHDVTIGGTVSGAGNLISGNGYGISSYDGYNVTIQGNTIGTDVMGKYAIPNAHWGVLVAHATATNITIGGTAPGAGNLVSGNSQVGVWITETAGPVLVEGNTIGTDINGSYAIGNGDGIDISGASGVTVGGATQAARNLISGNNQTGVAIGDGDTSNNVVEGNFIGTNTNGVVAIPNNVGVSLGNTNTNLIEGNLISGNSAAGAVLQLANGNTLQDNLIGTDVTGNTALPNQGFGVLGLNTDQNNTIGGTATGAGNVISSNLGGGIEFEAVDDVNNLVQGNRIGTNAAGTSTTGADGKSLGNTGFGVLLYQAASNTIGGTAAGAGNIISGTLDQPGGYPGTGYGVGIGVPSAVNNVIQGNAIGTDASGTRNLGNAGAGVFVFYGATNEQIGGTASGAANTIAFNAQDGVFVQYGYAVTVRGNSIHDNAGLGIDLWQGTGANHLQSYPVLTGPLAGSTTSVSGTLSSSANSTYTLDFYASAVANPSGYGEGKRYLGSATVMTDATGNATFTATGLGSTSPGEIISATATDATGDTSQFAADVTALAPTTTTLGAPTVTYGAAGVITVTVASALGTPAGNVSLTVDNGTPIKQALINGSSTFSVNGLSAGDHNLSVSYASQGLFAASATTGTIHVNKATPVLQVSDAGGGYNGRPYPATPTVNGGNTLEDVGPTLSYYNDTYTDPSQLAGLTPLLGAPAAASNYTVLATFGGSADYTTANALVTFTITPPPTAHLTSPTVSQSAGSTTVGFTLTASDPTPALQAGQFIYSIDWGDGTLQTVTSTATSGPVTHAYTAANEYIVSVTAQDQDGGVSTPATATVVVSTAASDQLTVAAGSPAGAVWITWNGITATYQPTDQVIVAGLGGTDAYTVNFDSLLTTPITIAGSGSDTLNVNGSTDSTLSNYIVKNGAAQTITWGTTAGPATESVGYSGIQNVNVYGGAGPNYITDPGSNTTIYGGPGANTITITATTGNGVTIHGGGSDTYVVDLGNLAGPVSIQNSNTGAKDNLIVNGATGNNTIAVAGNQITEGTQIITDTAALANLTVTGGSGNNQLTVSSLTVPVQSVTLVGGGGTNTYNVNAGTVNIVAGAGVNVLNVTGGTVASITAPAGDTKPLVFTHSYTVLDNGKLSVAAASGVLANSVSANGKALTAVLTSGPTHGTVSLNADGSFTYTPTPNFIGSDSFTYQAKGSDGTLSTSAPVTLQVLYKFSGFLPPLSQGLTYAVNRTIPIPFQLTDANGKAITSLSAVTSLQVAQVVNGVVGTPFTPVSTNNQGLQYTGGQYQFNWQTKGLAAGSYEIVLTLADGTTQTKTIKLTASGNSAGLVTDGSGGTTTAGALLGGEVDLYVDNSNGDLTSDELARVQDAVNSIDATIAPYGVVINEVSDPTQANVTLNMDTTSSLGGVAQGVLGCTTDADQVTMIQGWSWYAGADPTQVGAGQYDFETAVVHELGHVLGLGHSSNSSSVMYASLATGTANRALVTADLNVPDSDSGPCALHAVPAETMSSTNNNPSMTARSSTSAPSSMSSASSGNPMSAAVQLFANFTLVMNEMRNTYQRELSAVMTMWQSADAVAMQRLNALLSIEAGAMGMSKDTLMRDLLFAS